MNPWLIVSGLSLLALWLRTANRFPQVFGDPLLVNFTETDAWFHVRTIEQMVHHFPRRMSVDIYGRIDGGQSVDTGLFYDVLPAFFAWILRLSDTGIHILTAWYPALLGVLIVPVTFLCARAIFDTTAGLWAAAVVATLPGHFLDVGSLGFTDHHVMEALLTTLLLYLIVRETSPYLLGAALTAYLLTFAGGAFVVAMITCWYWLTAVREGTSPDSRRFAIACLIAVPFAWWQVQTYFMRFSLAALVLAATGLWLLPLFTDWCQQRAYPRLTYLGISAATVAVALGAVGVLAGDGQESLFAVLRRLTASGNRLAPTVSELRSLTGIKGFFSLEYPWHEYGGALILTLTGLPVLAESVWRRWDRKQTLLLIWVATFFLMAMSQARMTYYFGACAALLCGFLMSQLRLPIAATVAIGAFLILPNLTRAVNQDQPLPGLVTPDWLEALHYLRDQTPEPFATPPPYSVLAWWDYGYWITTIAHRVPVTNPTQANAGAAADFFLATDEAQIQAALAKTRARYVVVNDRLPLLGDDRNFHGIFSNLVAYTKSAKFEDFILAAQEVDESGRPSRRAYLRRKYFQTALVRLFLANGEAMTAPENGNFAVLELNGNRVLRKQQFSALTDARKALAQCALCELVSESPMTPCVDLKAIGAVMPAFASTTTAVRWQGNRRPEVQIYRTR